MGIKTWVGTLFATAIIFALAGCGGVSTNVHNPPPPPSSDVTIAFNPAPPSSLLYTGSAPVAAVVSNDPTNSGVDWALTCQNNGGNCGTIAQHTASGQQVNFIPPSTISSNNLTVTLSVFATIDHTKNKKASIAITAFGGSLQQGTYVIETKGFDSSGLPYLRAGVISLDGNGAVVGGEQSVNFVDPFTGAFSYVADAITGGSYFIGSDGRGTIAINTNDVNVGQQVGQQGVQTFSLVVLSNSHVLLTKLDDPTIPSSSNESSVGTLDLQTAPSAPPAKGYAFVTNGTDTAGSALALGGVFNIDSPQTISGTGSAFDQVGINIGAGVVSSSTTVSGTVSTPDQYGVFQVTLTTDFGDFQFAGYPVDATHVKLIESDGIMGLTAGDALSQGSATGTFKTKSTFTGNYVFGLFGRDSTTGPASLAAAGVFSTTGTGSLTSGYIDETQSGNSIQISDGFRAVYAVGPGSDPTVTTDPAGTGRFYIPLSSTTGFPNFTFSHGTNGTGPAWIFYLSGNGGPALMLDADIEPSLTSGLFGGGFAAGVAYRAATGASFSGSYGTIFTQNTQGTEGDVVGELAVNSNALTGVLDMNGGLFGAQVDDTSLTGTTANSAIPGRLTGTLTDNFFSTPAANPASLSVAFYPIDSTQGFYVENDFADPTGNVISDDLTFGYYTRRIPVCQGCP